MAEYDDSDMVPCSTCGRTFRSDVLAKHGPICQKVSTKKRRVFESGKQRATGSDVPITKIIKVNQGPPRDPPKIEAAANRKHNWRHKHEEFIRNIRAAKQYQHAAAAAAGARRADNNSTDATSAAGGDSNGREIRK